MPDGHDWRVSPIKQLHFETLKPLCPVCRSAGRESLLKIQSILKGDTDYLREGILICSNAQCLSEYPVIDGIPIIVANLRAYISQNMLPVLCRDDLSDTMESLLGTASARDRPLIPNASISAPTRLITTATLTMNKKRSRPFRRGR